MYMYLQRSHGLPAIDLRVMDECVEDRDTWVTALRFFKTYAERKSTKFSEPESSESTFAVMTRQSSKTSDSSGSGSMDRGTDLDLNDIIDMKLRGMVGRINVDDIDIDLDVPTTDDTENSEEERTMEPEDLDSSEKKGTPTGADASVGMVSTGIGIGIGMGSTPGADGVVIAAS